MRLVFAAATGALFAVGLLIAGMTEPAKVIAFLDLTGDWNPALALVMASAIAAHAPFVALARRRTTPLFEPAFHWPAPRAIDAPLLGGAALFGIGWGLSGYCPGPALVSAGAGALPVLVFVGAMIAGMIAARYLAMRARK